MIEIFCDLDGVLAAFDEHVFDWYDKPRVVWDEWDIDYEKIFGMTATEFWKGLTYDFWASIPPTKYFDSLVSYLDGYNPVILTSTPAIGEEAAKGKITWIRKHLPKWFNDKRYLIGPAKKYVSSPYKILIDDKEETIEDWNIRGGWGILFPRSWNRNSVYEESPGSVVFTKKIIFRYALRS